MQRAVTPDDVEMNIFKKKNKGDWDEWTSVVEGKLRETVEDLSFVMNLKQQIFDHGKKEQRLNAVRKKIKHAGKQTRKTDEEHQAWQGTLPAVMREYVSGRHAMGWAADGEPRAEPALRQVSVVCCRLHVQDWDEEARPAQDPFASRSVPVSHS